MSQSSSGTPARGGEHWAEVRAHDQVMRYRRSGAGRALLLLRSAERADSLWPELLEALASHFRLIVPDVPAHAGSAADWLVDFLEGIGMPGMGIVAADEL
ncbi:MAG TPA: hypothetical protein VNA66_08785, partial [Gammaproteobacteria bacterium]|nr:hypothetical protein [Gammaproteobacteria bacterium]